jgi:ribosomal protein L32
MTTTFKNHEEFLSWGDEVVGESYGCWAWVEKKMSEERDKFYWFARCLGALYHGDEALPFDEEEWVKTLSYVKKVYQYYYGEELPTEKTHRNYALVQDALDAISANASSCEKCGEWRMWGDECVECEKSEGEKCECGREFCRCGEGGTETPDEGWECCEMCGVPTNNEEWVDENGTGILYCEDCYNRMIERNEKKVKENPCEMCGGDDEEGCCETCGRHCEDCDKGDVVIIDTSHKTKRRVIKLGWCWEEKMDCELIKKLTEA